MRFILRGPVAGIDSWLIVGLTMFFLLLTQSVQLIAASPGDVVINEIAWMGTAASSSDEWIEFYNTTGYPIDIGNWSIYGVDTGKCLNFSDADGSIATTIPAYGYLIYANHEDDVKDSNETNIVDIWDATIGMNNTSPGQIILYDAQDCTGNVIDTANQSTGDWYAGEASPSYITMERRNGAVSGTEQSNWATNDPSIARTGKDADLNPINGTPKARNSVTNTDPRADAGPDQTVQTGDTVQLNASASSDPDGDPLSYTWSFISEPTGSTAALSNQTIANPTFVADIVAEYVLKLIVTDDYGGSDTDHVTITAHTPPTAAFTHSLNQPTTWDIIQFTNHSSDSDGTIVAWSWNFSDGESSSEQNSTHRYRLPGTYPVTLEVTDNEGLKGTTVRKLEVSLGPGDVDGSGTVDVLDVRIVMQAALGILALSSEQQVDADVDRDSDVDMDDATLLAQYVIGL